MSVERDRPSLWSLALPLGVFLLFRGARAETAPNAVVFYSLAGFALAVGVWSGPAAVETLAARPESGLRGLAGATRALIRPPLAVVLFALDLRLQARVWPGLDRAVSGLAIADILLGLSTFLALYCWSGEFSRWRSFGTLTLRLETPEVRPGGTVQATAETARACRRFTAALCLYDSRGEAGEDEPFARYEAAVALVPGETGRARVAVQVPSDAPPTLDPPPDDEDDEKKGDGEAPEAPWRYWSLELTAFDEAGRKAEESEAVEVKAA